MISCGISPKGEGVIVRYTTEIPKVELEIEIDNINEAETFFGDGKRLCELIKGESDEAANRS